MTGPLTIAGRFRRALGALVLLSLAMITAAPLVALTLGECERKCCRREKLAHRCCKRHGAVAWGISSGKRRCDAGNANVGLVRLTEAPGVAWRTVAPAEPAWGEAVGIGTGNEFEAAPHPHSLFQRPPPRA